LELLADQKQRFFAAAQNDIVPCYHPERSEGSRNKMSHYPCARSLSFLTETVLIMDTIDA
jgi:hypothetical protein